MDANNIQFTKIELQIVKYLFKHYQEKVNPRQLARLQDINHAHANKLCNSLVSKFLLKKEEMGNAAYFSFNYENKRAAHFMEYLFALEEKEFPKWLSVVLHSLKKFDEHIKFNDLDVLLVYDTGKKREIDTIKQEIRNSQLVEQPIRYVEITEKDILFNKNNKIFYDILSESLVFCNPEKYVAVVRKCHK
jgi:hypothetical protein